MFKRLMCISMIAMPVAWACSSSWPEPRQPLADAEAAARSARELGAEALPEAKLKVTLAEEQIAAAKARIADGDNERATYLLVRARADAELALALAHEQRARDERQRAVAGSNPLPSGAQP